MATSDMSKGLYQAPRGIDDNADDMGPESGMGMELDMEIIMPDDMGANITELPDGSVEVDLDPDSKQRETTTVSLGRT